MMMKKKLAFVLSGGGSRGALQAGALRALIEAGYRPDILTGTSIGAANAAFLAVHGVSVEGVQKLQAVWQSTVHQELLPTNLWWQTMRALFRRQGNTTQQRIREFAVANGLTPELRFGDINGVRLYLVAADLNAGQQVIFGENPEDSVLEGVLASMTLPPWMPPQEKEGRYLMDGAAVSNLPIEAALRHGAGEIIALDLFDPNEGDIEEQGLRPFLWKLDKTVENRQTELELELAKARGVRVRRMTLVGEKPVPIWDFRRAEELMARGYALSKQMIDCWRREEPPSIWERIRSKVAGGLGLF